MDKKIFFFLVLIFFLTTYLRWNDLNVLTGADPYYHVRKANEILNGEISDIDHLQNPPEGLPYKKNLYHYFLAYSSKLTPLPFEKYVLYVPVILSLLAVLIAYKIGELFNKYGGLFTAFFIATTPILVERTGKTFADTDAIILCFVLLLLFLSLKALLSKKLIYLFFLGFTLFLFQTTWSGFWYYSCFFLGFFLFYSIFKSREDLHNLKYFLIPFFTYVIPATLYDKNTLHILSKFYTYHIRADIVKASELAPITTEVSWSRLGMALPLGVLGSILLIYLIYKKKYYQARFALLFSFLIVSAFTLIGGYRFLYLFAIPLSIFASLPFTIFFQNLWRVKRKISVIFIIISLSLCAYHVSFNPNKIRTSPSGDLLECLLWMNENLEEDAVVLAWWDFGYWIEYIAKRPAYIDNGWRPLDRISFVADVFISKDTEKLKEYDVSPLYIMITDRELSNFEMISIQSTKERRIRYITKSGVCMVKENQKNLLFTKLYLDDAENLEDIDLVKDFGKVKLFKVFNQKVYKE
jgi:dolichyl-diphosphooligosaccharide--protein glycosyltransferase